MFSKIRLNTHLVSPYAISCRQEIMAELGKMESGYNDPHPMTSSQPTYATPTTSDPSIDLNLARSPSESGRHRVSETSGGRPAISRSILEERQRSIVRQLDSIHQVAFCGYVFLLVVMIIGICVTVIVDSIICFFLFVTTVVRTQQSSI